LNIFAKEAKTKSEISHFSD